MYGIGKHSIALKAAQNLSLKAGSLGIGVLRMRVYRNSDLR